MKWFLIVLIILFNIGCMVEPEDIWPNHHIPYDTTGLTIEEIGEIEACMILWEIASQHRVKFVNIQVAKDKDISNDCDILHIIKIKSDTNTIAIGTSIGYVSTLGGAKSIVFGDWFDRGIILHELGHALGLVDEILRPDRDEFVTITEDCNPLPRLGLIDFNKIGYVWYKYPYDYYSVMQYPGITGVVKKDGSDLPIQDTKDMMISLTDARIVFDIYSDSRDKLYDGTLNEGPK